jgi:hypothetical protein
MTELLDLYLSRLKRREPNTTLFTALLVVAIVLLLVG